jgi:hypothetical protein
LFDSPNRRKPDSRLWPKIAMEKNNQLGNLPFALEYIKRGFKIFPLFYVLKSGGCSCRKVGCKRVGKHPTTRNGVSDATDDEATVRQWWTESPYANIGLATGHGGLIVVDEDAGTDKKTGLPKVGPASLRALVEPNAALPDTLIANTGGGGRHLYFLSTKEIKNSQDVVGKHIDVRGYGGYVILPPSNHESGKKYSWKTDISTKIADMPEWFEKLAIKGEINALDDIDEKQAALLAKHSTANPQNFTPDQLVKLLEFIPADCDRDQWWQIGAALKKELGDDRGWKVWDEWSKKAPEKYDVKTAAVQWHSFVDKGLTGGTIFHFAKENGFGGFDTEAAKDPEIVDQRVWIISIKRFVEMKRLIEWDKEQFDSYYSPLFARGKPSEHVLKNAEFKRVFGCTYWPKREQFVTEINGQDCLNYWRPSDVKPAPGNVSKFLEHVAYLFPDGDEGDILLDYLAFQVQHPGEKVHWAVLIEGDQGNGKSYFATVMRMVLGAHNVRILASERLHETFTEWQRNKQLIVVEEMMAKQRLELMNKLKPMITEDWCIIREMYRPAYEQPNRFNFLFFTNHRDALLIENTDRRYCILKTEAPPHPDRNAYYGPLFDWTRNNAGAIAHYLGHRPLGDFKPKAHAPMTAGKRALILQSMNPLKQFIHQRVEAREFPCHWDLLTTSVLIEALEKENLRANPKEIGNVFTDLGYLDLGQQKFGKDRPSLWAVRNFETYSKMTGSQLRAVWLSQINGAPVDPRTTVDPLAKDRPRNPLTDQGPM